MPSESVTKWRFGTIIFLNISEGYHIIIQRFLYDAAPRLDNTGFVCIPLEILYSFSYTVYYGFRILYIVLFREIK